MIKLKNVSKFYYQDGVIAAGFSKVNLDLHIGEFVVITGESGSGKSTLLNVISGLDSYEEGEMYINGEETSHYTEEDYLEYRKKYVTNIFQSFNLVNSYTVSENIELAMTLSGLKKKERKKKVNELIELVNLKKFKNTKVSKLSGGQKQRVAIARALAYDTPIIVADEPTGSLDSKQSKEIIELFYKISTNKLVIIVTHNKNEVEKYATRLIRMHDGKLLEDKVVEKINKDKEVVVENKGSITLINKIKLGIRNSYNIPIKFILLLIIFFFIVFAYSFEYAIFESAKSEADKDGANAYFTNIDPNRIIIKKEDKTPLTKDDYNKIKKLDNIDYIVYNDLLNDVSISLNNDNYYLYGTFKDASKLKSVDEGRLPLKEDEVVLYIRKDQTYYNLDDLKTTSFKLNNESTGILIKDNLNVVGIKYNNDNVYTTYICITKELQDDIVYKLTNQYTNTKIKVFNSYLSYEGYGQNYRVTPSSKIKDGEVIVSNDFNSYCEYNYCLNKFITIDVSNIYYKDSSTFKVSNIYTKYNFKNLINEGKYEDEVGSIYISNNDYNKLYNKGNYQSSVFVKDTKLLESTNKELENLGFKTLVIKNALYDLSGGIKEILNIIKLVVGITLFLGLFFISYFVIKVILKSRNSYFATLRTLGASKKSSIGILMSELLFIATLSYILLITLFILVSNNIIKQSTIKEIISYIDIKDCIFIYIILLIMTVFITLRYSRKIFSTSVIKVYGEKV